MKKLHLKEIIHLLRMWWFGLDPVIGLKEHCRQQRKMMKLIKIWRKYGTEWRNKATTLEEGLTNLELQMMCQIDKCYEMGLKRCREFAFSCLIKNQKTAQDLLESIIETV
ncbi:hypothetical protein HAX54_024197 [Datura stramonium]|uniref:Uncharacterized protein n=1 Tax=Datura stramonium TaxID=4076 RepID=A0ABS8UXN2_DATST|nr:hypothetical protein [Datura stramonium]